MARSTRQQRQKRRAQAAGKPPLRPAARARPVEEDEEAPMESAEPRRARSDDVRPGVPGVRFVQEAVAELKKVEWPNQQAVISGTAVVIIASLIVGAYLWANDEVWKYVVQHVLLR
jgi:preprotein translocase SecE subunit